jgi:hypothetical protein
MIRGLGAILPQGGTSYWCNWWRPAGDRKGTLCRGVDVAQAMTIYTTHGQCRDLYAATGNTRSDFGPSLYIGGIVNREVGT